ncbi:hypothetical protein FBU30_007529 [Linnemannia zychae]|nr:hypothetical protein FBU30_007529 [Linnemannia zychae]
MADEPPELSATEILRHGHEGGYFQNGESRKQRADQSIADIANWLSVIGSLLIILHIPGVIQHVPSQKKRLLIIMFTAFSNCGFSIANLITGYEAVDPFINQQSGASCLIDYTVAVSDIRCTISAWCYVFFQLLTCTLVIANTFRLCGVFLFKSRRSIPSVYIAICPIISFLLPTPAAITGNFNFNECGHYCWFKLLPDQQDCKVRSLWAWLSFYGWMILFIFILFASTLFVLIKIALSVTSSRSDLKQVVNQATLEAIMADSPLQSSSSTLRRLRTMSSSFHNKTVFKFLFRDRRRKTSGTSNESRESAPNEMGAGLDAGVISTDDMGRQQREQSNTSFHSGPEMMSFQSPIERDALASSSLPNTQSFQPPPRNTSGNPRQSSLSASPTVPRSSNFHRAGSLGRKEKSFVVAILRQALLDMPQEGQVFETQFMQKCQELDPTKNQAKYDQLTRPPSYSWSLQYDCLAMPTDFQTSYPLSAALNLIPMDSEVQDNTERNGNETDLTSTMHPSNQQQEDIDGSGVGSANKVTSPTQIGEVSETKDTDSGILSRSTPAITFKEPLSGRGYTTEARSADYTQAASDPTAETSNTAAAAITTTTPAETAATFINMTSVDRNSNANITAPPNNEARIHPMSLTSNLEDLRNNYQSASSVNTSQDLDAIIQDDQAYLDKDMATDRNSSWVNQNREIMLRAPRAGDILHFPRLTKARSIGGGAIHGGSSRRYCLPANVQNGSSTDPRLISATFSLTARPTAAGAAGAAARTQDNNERRQSFVEKLLILLQGGKWNSAAADRRYQTQFRYPRFAYLVHRIVRVVYIPKEVRLPPIPDPFVRRPHVVFSEDQSRRSTLGGPSNLTITDVMGHEPAYLDIPNSDLTGLGLELEHFEGPGSGVISEYEHYDSRNNDLDDIRQASSSTNQ